MTTKKRGQKHFGKELPSEKDAWADDERSDDEVLDQGTQRVGTSGNPLSKTKAQASERRKDQSEESDGLVQTALMETYNG